MASTIWILASLGLFFVASNASAQKAYDPGASDTEIKLGQTQPYSGPASVLSAIGNAELRYFKMVNDNGGINGRKISLISYDDAYLPPKAVEQTRKLVESDEVLLIFQMNGTPSNAAVQKYLNAKKVPQLLSATGGTRFTNPKDFPWTIGFNPSYQSEGHIFAKYILADHPQARIGILYQNDDLGKDYVKGLKEGLGAKASTMIVAETSYEVSDPTIDTQIVKLKASGADLLYNVTTPKFGAQAIKKVAELGWKPVHLVDLTSSSLKTVLEPAGLENSKDLITVKYAKDPSDAAWKDDPGMKRYFAFMEKYYPEGDKYSTLNAYGYLASQVMEQILLKCGDNLTRENVLKIATSLNSVVTDLTLPGVSGSTSPTDYRIFKQFQMMRFTGDHWEPFGAVVSDDLTIQ